MKSHVSRKGKKEARRTALYSTCGLRWSRNNHNYEGHHRFNHMTRHFYSKDRKEHEQLSFSPSERGTTTTKMRVIYTVFVDYVGLGISHKYAGHHLFNHMRLGMFIPRRGRNTTVFVFSAGMRRKIH